MFVTEEWINNLRLTKGENFVKMVLKDSYTDRRGNLQIKHENLAAALENPPPENMMKKFTGSMNQWVKSGFKKVGPEVYQKRMEICRKCEFWQENVRLGYGKCLKCGCGKGKHWLPHEQCPIGKWGKEMP